MKALYKTKNGRLQFEVEGKAQNDLFEQIASIQEVFDDNACGLCGKTNLRLVVREVDDNKFYEVRCEDCQGRLSLSQNKKGGTLYPVRKLKNGKAATINDEPPFDFKTKGWYKWVKPKNPPETSDKK
jgi:hypothetical protein